MRRLLGIFMFLAAVCHGGVREDLAEAIEDGNVNQVKVLLKKGVNLNEMISDNEGYSEEEELNFLEQASLKGNLAIAKLLVEAGADVNMGTPLFVASFYGQLPVVEYLVSKGANLRHPDTGWTALISACSGGHLSIVRYLLDKGTDVNAADVDGETALMYAAEYDVALVKVLTDKKADINAVDTDGESVFDWALRHNNQDVIDYLKKLGAKSGSQTRR